MLEGEADRPPLSMKKQLAGSCTSLRKKLIGKRTSRREALTEYHTIDRTDLSWLPKGLHEIATGFCSNPSRVAQISIDASLLDSTSAGQQSKHSRFYWV